MEWTEAIEFDSREAWGAWLEANHDSASEVWIVHHKKASPGPGVRYPEGVEEALRFGWIDSKMRRIDDLTFAQRYSPRKPTSVWSDSNKERVERLMAAGLMAPAGVAAVEAGKRSGMWDQAWNDREPVVMPGDLDRALGATPGAREAFEGFANSYRNQYVRWVVDAKRPETRERRIGQVVERSMKGLKPGE